MRFLRYVSARADEALIADAYRIYVTDALKLAVDNVGRLGGGAMLDKRWYELVHPEAGAVEEERSAEEIIEHISAGLAQLG